MTRLADGIKKMLNLGKIRRLTKRRSNKLGGTESGLITDVNASILSRPKAEIEY